MFANSAVLSKDKNQLRIPKITPAEAVLLFVDLAQVTSHTPEQVEAIALGFGYSPELRIAEYIRNGKTVLEPALLIHHGAASTADDGLLDNWKQLVYQIQPATAVHLRSSQPLAA